MHVDQILWNPRFTHQLVRDRAFQDDAVVVVDVGMRGGAHEHWKLLGDQVRFIGFDPDEEECQRINERSSRTQSICYPVALDSAPRRRKLLRRPYNRAADGLCGYTWWSSRLGLMEPREITDFRIDQPGTEEVADAVEIETTTLDQFARDIGLKTFDFLKVSAVGAELDVLRGAERFLGPGGAIGIEAELRLLPTYDRPNPVFLEVYNYLHSRGYYLYNVSLHRLSRKALPMPVASDHRDHLGEPILGPTTRGQLDYGDAVFFRDLVGDRFDPKTANDVRRVLKAASLFEIYNLPDCAAELLLYYRDALASLASVDDLLAQLVPDQFGRAVSLQEYLGIYRDRVGRI
jgi:FkbM family methyltransferase